jgi:hypothetical protein
MKFNLAIKNDGIIGGFSGIVTVNGKRFRVPGKVVRTQESANTEDYCEICSYDSAEEVRNAAKRFVARKFAHA